MRLGTSANTAFRNMLQEIESLSEIKLPKDKSVYLLLDVDQTLINPNCYIANPNFKHRKIFDALKKLSKEGIISDAYTQNILAVFRKHRPEILIEENWPDFINETKNLKHTVLALTCLPTGNFIGLNSTIEKWRYDILNNLGINFSNTVENTKLTTEENNYISLYQGIIQTGKYNKNEALKAYLKHSKAKPEAIYFVDDKIDYLQEVENLTQEYKIEFSGYLYQGLKHFKYSDFSPSKAEKQLQVLLNFAKFIHDRDVNTYKISENAQLIDESLYKVLLVESEKLLK